MKRTIADRPEIVAIHSRSFCICASPDFSITERQNALASAKFLSDEMSILVQVTIRSHNHSGKRHEVTRARG